MKVREGLFAALAAACSREPGDFEMSVIDGGEGRQTANESGIGQGARIAIGATALAAVLGVGAFIITDQMTKKPTEATDLGALAPVDASAAPGESPSSGAASLSASGSALPQAPGSASMSSVPKDVEQRIREAREKAAKDGVKVTRPLPQNETAPVVGLTRTTVGSLKQGGIVRLVTARSDLTGQQELAWVAGGITKHGDVECSQTFRLYNNPEAQKKPNLLLCWRTSAKKSVVAVVVDPKGKPSTAKALKELDNRWRSMG